MIGKTLIGNHSGCSGIIVKGPVTISLWSGISDLIASAVNSCVYVRCCARMRNADVWNWNAYLEWILADREGGEWSWFSLLLWNFNSVIRKRYHNIL